MGLATSRGRVAGAARPPDTVPVIRIRFGPALLLVVAAAGCRGGERTGRVEGELGPDGLALPPSASAPRRSIAGDVPDTLATPERPPVVQDLPGPEETVGPVPPSALDVAVIVNLYAGKYRELFHELGSDVRNDVDPRLVEDAKRKTALDFGFVQAGAWNQMVGRLSGPERGELAERIAMTNRDLAVELHGRQPGTR